MRTRDDNLLHDRDNDNALPLQEVVSLSSYLKLRHGASDFGLPAIEERALQVEWNLVAETNACVRVHTKDTQKSAAPELVVCPPSRNRNNHRHKPVTRPGG